ncbi:Putative uncharacterized protein [Moritella viscosa]|uniref:DUF4150 domain-containing protein n=1 Tax=Moritella viscosa TaxID=80854 RepID=UPI00091A6CB3|nr:DUF4150 domain-containing protein [Moritella viscosa]SGY92376.1 Putative uncharacterized protein [Moritella viscosa]
MAITVSADGLSIIHKDSGGKASATLPDVCLTTVGNAVVPIPYGNSAESVDLDKGTTTVTMDGGNSIAIKGSIFAKSTGDAGGDKKGISSGTIEGEASFISCSPTVKFEGKGVCRLSDQMTMNKGNTLCLGGAQNPSVTLSVEEEGTYTVVVTCLYHDGYPFKNAGFDIVDAQGAVLGSGKLSASGVSSVSDIPPGRIGIVYKESDDDFVVLSPLRINSYYRPNFIDDAFFDSVSQAKQPFWKRSRMGPVSAPWGVTKKILSSDPDFSSIVKLETMSHFTHQHPNYSFNLMSEQILASIDSKNSNSIALLAAQVLPFILDEGDILSVILRLPEHETPNNLLAYMRARGKGNPQSYLQNYDWDNTNKNLNNELDSLLNKIKSRIESMKSEADRLDYVYLSNDIYSKHIDTIKSFKKSLSDKFDNLFKDLQSKTNTLLNDSLPISVTKDDIGFCSAEAQKINNVVNSKLTIDLEEQKWVKIRAIHADRWQTPLLAENVKITTDSVVHVEKAVLNKKQLASTVSKSKDLALETQINEGGVIAFDDLKPTVDIVTVEFKGESGIEKDIADAQKSIETYLDGIYHTLVKDMSGFKQQWDEEGLLSLGDGVISGVKGWGNDLVELFSPQVWVDMGRTLASSSTDAFDYLYNNATDTYNSVTKSITDEDGNLHNVTWFTAQIAAGADDLQQSAIETIDDAIDSAQSLYDNTGNFLQKLECLAKNRQALLNLPGHIAEGDIDAIELFVDTVLMELDPEWAKEIKESDNFLKALFIIQDPSSALLYSAYLTLIIEAIPPNFYSYYAGKAGAYILLEVIFTIVISILTLGAGTAARIAAVTAKMALGTKRVSNLSHAEKALDTFIDTTKGLVDVLQDYDKLADKLIRRPLGTTKGRGNETITMTKANIKRDGKCRLCQSNKHRTPRYGRGELEYI